ncbi:Kdo hydrolase subunit 2 [Helicobacter sp. NHP19-012]|uniref:Kdo hydrolase subunit 2 n=1 Tax=Helicobacter gastrofelis TaxID=2849642 RepID=A0ABN6I832_9HELI|nr:sialidase family protein [Helicobacter sp. NHP19-012]BCZ19628.1 Kdo hydrolase subunit 2 [Helicobacter sp. NHP19-012]
MHSASLIALDRHILLAAYFGGSKEGQSDVCVWGNLYNTQNKQWSKAFKLLSASDLSRQAHEFVKILGNPVLYAHKDKLYLFVVGASLGGWATSRIYVLNTPLNKPKALHYEQTLHLSPFLNISHLVRNPPTPTTDGGFILPIYHELARKSPVLLKFDNKAHLQFLLKPNSLKQQLQPSLVPYKHCAFVAFRSYKTTHFYTQTCLDFWHWQPPRLSNLKNFDSANALFNANGELYLIYNQALPKNPNARSALRLARFNATSGTFMPLKILDTSQRGEVSYPAVLIFNNQVHVLYTKERKAIAHLVFNLAYLKSL